MTFYLTQDVYDRAVQLGIISGSDPSIEPFAPRLYVPNPIVNWKIEPHTFKRGQTKRKCKRKQHRK